MQKPGAKLRETLEQLCFFAPAKELQQTMVNLATRSARRPRARPGASLKPRRPAAGSEGVRSADRDGRVVLRLAHYFAAGLHEPLRRSTACLAASCRAAYRGSCFVVPCGVYGAG